MRETGVPSRLLFEGAVIVASILLAFAVDAAWDDHLERRQLEGSFDQIREQLYANRMAMSEAISDSRTTTGLLEVFTTLSPDELATLPLDSLRSVVWALLHEGIYDQNGGYVEGFVADGRANLVADPELRMGLRLWASLEAELAEDYDAVTSMEPALRQVMAEYGVVSALTGAGKFPGSPDVGDAVRGLRSDLRALDLAVQRSAAVESYIRNLELYHERLFGRLRAVLGDPDGMPPE